MIVPIRFTVLLSIILMLFANSALGQDDPFRAEIGLQVGANSYSGDVNTIADLNNYTKNLDNLSTEVGMLFRYRFSKRLALRAGYEFSSVKGNYRYRDGNEQYRVILNNPLHAVDIWGEFNFFDLENNPYKRFSKRYSPFIFMGIGAIQMPQYKSGNSNICLTLPVGFGFKMKMAERLNFNVLLTHRISLGDGLEGVSRWDNPAPTTISNLMNNDQLTGISVSLSYDFWRRNCNCNENTFSAGKKPKAQKAVKQQSSGTKKQR